MALLLFALTLTFYLFFQSSSIYGGDAGDLVSASYLRGVAHPPGYPLYTFLGSILTHIPVHTAAWRMSLLSSIPASLTIVVLYILLRRILQSTRAAFIGASTLGVTYVYWLYAITPEVFALHLFFLITLFFFMWEFYTTRSVKFLYICALIFGLSMTHHHIILFVLPAFAYLFVKAGTYKKYSLKLYGRLLGIFTLGLLPYLSVVFAARAHPMINWNEPYTLSGLIQLITRATYGTFQSGPLAGQSIVSRLLEIPVILEFILNDFTILGVVAALIGGVYLFKINRVFCIYTGIAFVSVSFLYFFYAFYPVDHPFAIATLERFLLPGYLFFTIFIAAGTAGIVTWVDKILDKRGFHISLQLSSLYSLTVFLLLPGLLFYINYPKLSPLTHDMTAEEHGKDILRTPKTNSILFLQRDSTLFDTQYVYFTQAVRSDIVLIHYYRFYKGELSNALIKHYPNLVVPEGRGGALTQQFIDSNYRRRPVYANIQFKVNGYVWVRQGLLYRLYRPKDIPTVSSILMQNDRLWKSYSDPLSGSLGQYRNLMLANILDFYKEGRIETGLLYYDAGFYEKALSYYTKAVTYNDSDPEIYFHRGLALSKLLRCSDAEKSLRIGLEKGGQKRFFYEALMLNARDCFRDPQSSSKWQKLYEMEKNSRQTKLKEL